MQQIREMLNRLVYNNEAELLFNRYKRSQDYFIIQAVFVTAFGILTGGVAMTGFFIYMGASDEIVSITGLLPNIVGVVSIFASLILERFSHRKKLIGISTLVVRWLVCSIVLVPLIVPGHFQVSLAILVLSVAYMLQSLISVALNIWYASVVPENIRGRYFGIRQMFCLIVSIVLPIAVGAVLDISVNKYAGFVLLYGIGALLVFFEFYTYKRIEEPAAVHLDKGAMKIADIFRVPLQNKKFLYFTLQVCFIYFMLFLSASFTSVYMIRYLKLSYTFISMMGILSAGLQMFFYRVWGRISDRYGHSLVMRLSIWFYILEFGIWCLVPASKIIFVMPVAYVVSAIDNPGFATSVFNYRYSLMPEKGRSLFEGFFVAALGVSFLISPMAGGIIKGWLESIPAVAQSVQFGQFRLLYGVTVVGLAALQVINLVMRKRGNTQIPERIKIDSL